MKQTLSGLVVAHNEEKNLADCLASLHFCDALVVVLDHCTDGSKAIAQRFGATLVEGSWPTEGQRRHAGLDVCTTDWILELDADERVPPALATEITALLAQPPSYTYFTLPLDNYVGTTRVRHGWGAYFGTSAVKRLFKRGTKLWGDQRIHPQIAFTGEEGPRLKNRLVHYVDNDVSDMLQRLDRYTSARAVDLKSSGALAQETFGKNLRRVFSRFYKCYVGRRGYKEGKYGFLIALCAGLYPLLSYLKATLDDPPHAAH